MSNKILFNIVVVGLFLASCTKDFQEINTDPNNITAALPQQLLAPALVTSMNYNLIRNRNFNNELMQVTVDLGDGDGKVFRYDYRASFSNYLYNGLYSELTNFKDIFITASNPVNENDSYKGISLICQSWLYSILTDTYGDIPYFQSNKARDSAILEPAFTKQKDIYLDMFKQLDSANAMLSRNKAIVAAADPVFNGNISNWRRFGNSLYLRLLMRVSGKAEVSALAAAKIKDIVETNAVNYPLMTSNDNSAILRWTGVGPYVSPLLTVREQDFRGSSLASFFIDNLVVWNDPRIDVPTWGMSGFNRWGIATYLGAYEGVPSGYTPGTVAVKKSYFYSSTSAFTLQNEPLTGMIMNYAELQFILAEAAVKGYIGGSAAQYYKNGTQASITQWIPAWNVPIDSYLMAADIEWDNNASLDAKMERLHLQKYYAMFFEDMQQWFEYRRTGHPILPKGTGLANGGVMPARMAYPVYVQSTNPTNYQQAIAAQGPDVISTQVWWQKP